MCVSVCECVCVCVHVCVLGSAWVRQRACKREGVCCVYCVYVLWSVVQQSDESCLSALCSSRPPKGVAHHLVYGWSCIQLRFNQNAFSSPCRKTAWGVLTTAMQFSDFFCLTLASGQRPSAEAKTPSCCCWCLVPLKKARGLCCCELCFFSF